MAKYIKLEDAIRKYAEMIASDIYWEYGVGNGKPDEEDLDVAREYYSDLPTIEVSEDAINREGLLNTINAYMTGSQQVEHMKSIIKDAPSVTTEQSSVVGEWISQGDCGVTKCNRCGWSIEECIDWNYCPDCGAKMRLE